MIEAKGRKIPSRLERCLLWIEMYGNSVAFYILLVIIVTGVWQLLPIPGPAFIPNGSLVGYVTLLLIGISALHGFLWWVLTRDYIKLPDKVKLSLSLSIRLVKPLHMITGMLGLGMGMVHGFVYLAAGFSWNFSIITGLVGLAALVLLTLDGIGLMVSQFLSRKAHRWIAFVFLVSVAAHLLVVLF
ncbi:hypothetical protein J2S00_002417 [Caldalkalibacillus uzonensis]|uniref:Uncharacterized protein n=1 Tax=Caldalkalibacillus uzonensis TaxID=353224 RepID=A0ABU0CTG4_9BACI|nr:hypothetical protein [Caldalkalibacillus uzonensis]MDQ0339629.1 hypothetical protein [Caldalkalibacillus uzonensis]